MRSLLLGVLFLALTTPSRAGDKIVILGDSLSKEYEFSFRFDGFADPSTVRNWIEILDAERNEHFDLGSHIDINVLFVDIFFRHQYNWAVPGSKIAQISSFLRGEIEFIDFYSSSNPTAFEAVINSIALFITDGDFDLADLDHQIRNDAERVVLLAGGNDIDEVYREIYEADPTFDADAWIEAFLAEAEFIMDWVLARNQDIEFVVVALPHVGITPTVKTSHPTDPFKTARVTAVMRELNRGLAALTQERNIAFADIFEPMLRLLDPDPACIHGVPFINDVPPPGGDPGDLRYVWLNGLASDGFHPNTNAQAVMANEIIRTFNRHYRRGIPPLTATEILHDWLGQDPEVTFSEWLTCFGLPDATADDDRDRDGLPAALEFGVGADPTRYDPWHVTFTAGSDRSDPFVELAYPLRLPDSANVSVRAESSSDLSHWMLVPNPPGPDPDGLWRARLPLNDARGFLRLGTTIP